MPLGELALGVAAYLLTGLSLALASWALAERALPGTARLGLRLSAILAGQFALSSIVVQTLGIFGLLRVPWYLAASLAPGIAVLWLWRRRRPLVAFFGLLRRAFRLWIRTPPWALGWLGLLCLIYFAKRAFVLPRDIDALTLHGPMIVEWIAAGRVVRGSFWNYPQCWEYQFVPSFLLLRSDVLVAVPALLAVLALVLAVRELAARLALGGKLGHLLAFAVATMPIVWREPLKNDPVFAFALLLGILAVDRAARRLRGSFWLIQLSAFLVFGTKPSGFLYVGALSAVYLAVFWLSNGGEKAGGRLARLLPALLFTVLFQSSAAAVQLKNFWRYGNPVFPLRFELLGRLVFPGRLDLSGTAILDHLGEAETWKLLLFGGGRGVGAEWPLLPALALLGAIVSVFRLLAARRLPGSSKNLALILPLVALFLWILFLATPWSRGFTSEASQFLRSGNSLRYAIAALALSYLIAAMAARRFLGRAAFPLLGIFFPLLVFEKWSFRDYFGDDRFFLQGVFATWILLAGLDLGLRRRRLASRLGPEIFGAAFLFLLLVLATFSARWVDGFRGEGWAIPHRSLWTAINRLPPGTKIGTNDPTAPYRYFLYGPGFENQIIVIDLAGGGEGQIPDDLAYFYFSAKGEAKRQALIDAMGGRGWRVLAKPEEGTAVLLERSRP